MGMMDNAKSNMNDTGDDMQQRFNELRDKEASGMLDDQGRAELQQLRESMGNKKE